MNSAEMFDTASTKGADARKSSSRCRVCSHHAAQQIWVTVELKRGIHLGRGEAVEARKKVLGVAHPVTVPAKCASRS